MTTKIAKKTNVRTFVSTIKFKKVFTNPTIFKTTAKNKQGIEVPAIVNGKYWYVVYYYRNPETKKLQEFRVKDGVNRFSTITLRTKAIKLLQKEVLLWLQEGYSPYEYIIDKKDNIVHKKSFTAKEAIEIAKNEKLKLWSENARSANVSILGVFIRFLESNNLYNKDVNEITKRQVIIFLNDLGKEKNKPVNFTTRNSYRKTISSIFNQLVNDEIIEHNFIESIPILKGNPQKNTPFRKTEIKTIKEYLLQHDPYLYLFIKFVMYGFFRPVEVCRIKIKDINFDRNTISVQSKTEQASANVVYITKQLQETIETLDLKNLDKELFIFTKDLNPGSWSVSDTRKRTWFGSRFLKVKLALGFDETYGIYSFRHTAAIDLFSTYQQQGLTDLEAKHKMLPITRHKSVDSLNKYLRDIGASLPKDYSDDYTFDF